MNSSFEASDVFLRTSRITRTAGKPVTNRASRKRRANSDSELTFMENEKTYFNHHVLTMHNDDIDIDIMTDSTSDSNVLSDNSAMDPSQMFIIFTNPQDGMTYNTPPQNVLHMNSEDLGTTVTNAQGDQQIVSSSVLDNLDSTAPLFQTQIYLVNNGLHSENVQAELTEEQVTGIYAIQTSKELPNMPGHHIPAKFLKKKLPSQLTSKPVASQVATENGKDCINQQWITMKEDKTELKEKGCKWKSGIWSNEEEELLRNNIDEYCKKCNISDPTFLIYSTQKDNRKPFYRSIAAGLNRPLFAVYRKVLRMYDRKNYVGKYSDEEVMRLEQLCHNYKNNWAAIGLVLGRSAASVKDRARLLKYSKKSGKWDNKELEMLSNIIREMTSTKVGESVTVGINWTHVAEKIETRTEKQCRTKWLNYLNWKEAGGKQWLKTDEIELINRISKSSVTEESQLDWNELSNGWPSVRSPQWLRSKWWSIKKNCPDYQTCTFQELMTYVKTVYIEEIWEKLKKASGDDESLLQKVATLRATSLDNTNNAVLTNAVTGDTALSALQVTLTEPLIGRNFNPTNDTYEIPGLQFELHLAPTNPQQAIFNTVTVTTNAQTNFDKHLFVSSENTTNTSDSTLSDSTFNHELMKVLNANHDVKESLPHENIGLSIADSAITSLSDEVVLHNDATFEEQVAVASNECVHTASDTNETLFTSYNSVPSMK